ncbi:MAG TPA: hypothetical protein VIE90_01445 [Candidatus Binatia bacterium]|jgi:hypothetical protein
MMQAAAKKAILRIELWHALLLLVLLAVLGPASLIDVRAFLLGGVFMGLNFILLGFGIAWVLAPLAGRGRVKAGIGLLVAKTVLFLGLLMALFYRVDLDVLSFALGFSSLLVAIFVEAIRRAVQVEA